MNIRSLTRGDGVVIGAAVVLFIASFLDFLSVDCPSGVDCPVPNAWDSLGTVMSVYLGGIIAAGLVVAGRAMPGRKVVGLDVAQFGVALSIFALWTIVWTVIDIAGNAGAGAILGLLGTLLLAAGAIATPLVPALKAPLIGAPRPQSPQPYGAQPQGGYGYPGAQQQPYGQHGQQQPYGGQQARPQGGGPAQEFSPFWFAVPVARPLYAEDGSPAPIAELAPGTWYLAVDQRGPALVAQTQDGRRGVLQDTSGIQRG
ncbi:DUF5336 domain-containing protein [Streptomyces tirandamycinicus]|uniref:DUF5336 domain-containing protein n=1 Tax=Streptomyces TaxID=1883 RepID=UPI0003A4A55B|nr:MULTISPECIES: DUF5336 domain-containing protein [Streptomyces]MCY0980241.1 DUF5336 domain-containing protein [Streptomyces tirandamycinicus]